MQEWEILFTPTLVGVFGIIYLAVLSFLISGILRLKNEKINFSPSVSVIVAARNEERNLDKCLKALEAQNYPKALTQVIIVDDRSTDRTLEILQEHKSKNANLEIVQISKTVENISPKKYALSQGISRASGSVRCLLSHGAGELIFTTDADCTPPPDWISQTVPLFQEHVGVVIGLAPMDGCKNLWGKLLCLDSLATACVSAGATGWNVGVTCTGRNLAYRKSVFDEVHGFEDLNHSLSGDDDLLLQKIKKHTRWRINFSLNPRTAVPSPAPANFSAFVSQKRRHVSAGKYYSKPLQAAYLLFNLANIYLFVFAIFAFFNHAYLSVASLFFGLKLLLDFIALFLVSRKIGKQGLLFLFPLWELFFLLNQMLIAPLGFVGKIKWK